MDNLYEMLDNNNNFHLKLKAIQFSDDSIINNVSDYLLLKNKSVKIIKDDYYNNLLLAYNNHIDYVLIDKNIDFMIPLVTIITSDEIDIIKPMIPVIYMLKDNRIIQKVKTKCNKTYASYQNVKNLDDLFIILDNFI